MSDDLLTTKLQIPPLRAAVVTRSRLVARLNSGLNGKLTLVSAPAGSGKTTLLANWLQQSNSAGAWFSVDKGDNDLIRFWTYVIAAIQTAQPDRSLGEPAAAALRSAPAPMIERVLSVLINELVDTSGPVIFVLDDYHLIEQPAIHQSLTFLLEHMPATLHLVIASRTDPALPLARLRVRGQLNELAGTDLRFSEEETASFLKDVMGLHIPANEVADLEARTEGWIAALQIAALSLQGRSDTAGLIRQFQGSHRYLLDYLAEEVLQQQPPAVQQFLLCTSILERFNASLCDAVTQMVASQGLLRRLERDHLFLIPLDNERHWFRYHHLFGDFLNSRLQVEQPDLIPDLHLRASAWLEKEGFLESAVEHAFAATDHERAARLIERYVSDSFRHRANVHVYRWLIKLPEEIIQSRPLLGLAYAWGLCRDGKYASSEEWLSAVEDHYGRGSGAAITHLPSISDTMLGEIESVRAVIACFRGDMATAMTLSRRALLVLPAEEHVLRGLLADNMAMNIADAVGGSGDLAAAGQIYREAVSAGRASGNNLVTAFALNRLAQWQREQGQLHFAADSFGEVLLLSSNSRQTLPPGEVGAAHLGLGELAYQWNQLAEADDHLRAALDYLQTGNPLLLPTAHAAWSLVLQAQGKPSEARDRMRQAVDLAHNSNITWMASNISAAQARLALRQGDLEAASRWADTCGLEVGDELGINHLDEYTTLARIRLAQGGVAAAGDLLSWLHNFVASLGLLGSTAGVLLLQALVSLARDDTAQAVAALSQSVSLAAPEGYIRLYLDEGTQVAQLLEQLSPDDAQAAEYLSRLRQAFSATESAVASPHPDLDPLSDREIEVLRLLAAGLSSSEIAAELTIAVSTVRTHRKNIYSKLDVHSRYEAVLLAQELHLL